MPSSTPAYYRPTMTGWFTSSRTNNGNQCVEVRFDGDAVHIRDSKFRRDPANRPEDEPVITVTATVWTGFLAAVRGAGRSQVVVGRLRADPAVGGQTAVRHGATCLNFTPGEWQAFVAGVRDGEFDRVPVPG